MASIRKITGSGGVSYKITVSMGRDPQDKQIRHFKTWKPDPNMTARQMEKEVRRIACEFERNLEIGYQADNRQTFAQYAEYVYTLREQRGEKPQTLVRVRNQTERINEYIGHIKLLDIRPQHLNALYKKLSEPGSNHWKNYAVPAVDFNEMRGEDDCNAFGRKCGVNGKVVARLCNGGQITKKNAEKIENALGRKDLFHIIGTDRGLSPITIRNYHGIICGVLAQAVKEMILPYNPAEKVTLPPRKRVRTTDCLQPDTLRRVLEALEAEPVEFRAMINLLAVTGCRRGELLGLKWEKVDFERNQIKIDRSLNYTPERGVYEGLTKTENTRFVTIPAATMALLRRHRAQQAERRLMVGDQWQNSGYVFTRYDGRPQNPGALNCLLAQFCERHGLPHINPHQFRHTAASVLLANGIDVLTVSKMLGHRDTTTTLNIYGHAIEEAQRNAARCISGIILGQKDA